MYTNKYPWVSTSICVCVYSQMHTGWLSEDAPRSGQGLVAPGLALTAPCEHAPHASATLPLSTHLCFKASMHGSKRGVCVWGGGGIG